MNVKINGPYTFNIFRENGYIINYQIIQLFEEFYQSKKFHGFFKNDPNLNQIYKKYWNQAKYLSSDGEINFITESLQNLPKDYIKEIQEKNNSQFLYNLQNSALYKPLINYVQNNQQYYYFNNSVLLNEYLGNFILSFLHEQNVIQKVQYIILNHQLIIMHNSNIYTGNINNNNSIFVPEIMICCKDANE